jgi:tRNA-specific 2-thiouridylase
LPVPDPVILVALSGGVDSAVAAALLQREGRRVVGAKFRFVPAIETGEPPDVLDARRIADHLGIALHVLDLADLFRARVIGRFTGEYLAGRTPSPCLYCNREMKFAALRRLADEIGADAVATGHYARREIDPAAGRPLLRCGVDRRKDQSYFLALLAPDDLERAEFPLGTWTKDRVRALARDLTLPVAEKAESQELCFVPGDDYRGFLAAHAPEAARPGEIVDGAGRVVGRHPGIAGYTIGQRRGLGVAAGRALYVVAIDAARARVVVGDADDLFADGLVAQEWNWLVDPAGLADREAAGAVRCRIRYKHPGVAARVSVGLAGEVTVRFAERQRAVTPGQAAVLYDGDRVLGGGWIARAFRGEA